MKRHEIEETCAFCDGDKVVTYQHPLREEDCPECLGLGKVFVGYAEEVAPKLHALNFGKRK